VAKFKGWSFRFWAGGYELLTVENTNKTRKEMVFETSVYSLFSYLTRLMARENFIILSRRESKVSYKRLTCYERIHRTSGTVYTVIDLRFYKR